MRTVIAAVLLVASVEIGPQEASQNRPPALTLLSALSDPASAEAREIVADGWCNREFEEAAIYLTHDDYEYANQRAALWLDMAPSVFPEWKGNVLTRCQIRGRVDTKQHGHLGLYPATITNVTAARVVDRRISVSKR